MKDPIVRVDMNYIGCEAVLNGLAAWADVPGQFHAKRALEVALAGGHTITFLGNEEAKMMAQVAVGLGVTAWAEQTCPCGRWERWSGGACTCTTSQVSKWRKRAAFQNALNADIVVQVPPPSDRRLKQWLEGQKGEPLDAVLERVETAGVRPGPHLEGTAKTLMMAAVKQLGLGLGRAKATVRVAQTIAALARTDDIGVVRVAEAVQYRPRPK